MRDTPEFRRFLSMCFALFLLFSPTAILAEDDLDFSEMSLEDLLNVEVVTASKQAESQWDAPGVVTVVTSQEIARFGANNLLDVLDRVVGLTYTYGIMDHISARGAVSWGSQYHHLLLIDGRPMRTGGNNAIHNAYTAFPLINIDRIEIIRGPGSVLYGTNAFFGVINLITKKTNDSLDFSAKAKTGSFGTSGAEAALNYQKGDFTFSSSFTFNDSDGWPSQTADLVDGHLYERDVFDEAFGGRALIEYKGFKFSAYTGHAKHFANHWMPIEDNFFEVPWSRETTVTHLNFGYEHKFNDRWSLAANITHNEERFLWRSNVPAVDELVPIYYPSSDRVYELTSFGQFNDKLSIVFGGTFEQRSGQDSPNVQDYDEEFMSFYTQLSYTPTEKLRFIGGGQYISTLKVEGSDTKEKLFVPRIGMIANFNESAGMKLLYGEAFRAPTALDRLIDSPPIQRGDPNLESEIIATTDLQFFYHPEKFQFALTLFNSDEENLVVVLPSSDPDYQLQNTGIGEKNTIGAEFESKFVPSEKWYILASATYQENEDQDGVEDTTLLPNFQFKAGFSYTHKKFTLSVFDIYNEAYTDNEFISPGRNELNPPPNDIHYVTVDMSYTIKDFRLELFVQNALDETLWVPQKTPVFSADNTFQGRGEMGAYFNVSYKY